jgi:hypothetical protein
MTSKTLAQPRIRPLAALSFWMVVGWNVLSPMPGHAGVLEMVDLVTHPEHYDHQDVIVIGRVKNVQPVIDREGQPAFKFFLEDGSGTLKVITHSSVEDGEQVIVQGVFTRRRQGGRIPVYNELNATSVRPLNGFNPDFVG